MVDAMVDDMDSRAFNPKQFVYLVLGLLRKGNDVAVGRLDRFFGQLYRCPYGDSEFQGGYGLVYMMNYSHNRSSCQEARPPRDSMSNIINDDISIFGQSAHEQRSFQMYPEPSSSPDNLDTVNQFFLL